MGYPQNFLRAQRLLIPWVPFELIPYEVDESNLAAEHVAAQLGEPIEQVFKTLVLWGQPGRGRFPYGMGRW